MSTIICLLIIGNISIYNKYKVLEANEKIVLERVISYMKGDFDSIDYYSNRILEGDKTKEELTLDLIKTMEYSRMISVRVDTLKQSEYTISIECSRLMEYIYNAYYGILYDYLGNNITTEDMYNKVCILKEDMAILSDFIASTEIQGIDDTEFKEVILPKITYEEVLDRIKLHY